MRSTQQSAQASTSRPRRASPPRISAARRAEAMENLREHITGFFRPPSISHSRPPDRRYYATIIVDTVGYARDAARPDVDDYVSQFCIGASGFMDDFGSLVYTTRFA